MYVLRGSPYYVYVFYEVFSISTCFNESSPPAQIPLYSPHSHFMMGDGLEDRHTHGIGFLGIDCHTTGMCTSTPLLQQQ